MEPETVIVSPLFIFSSFESDKSVYLRVNQIRSDQTSPCLATCLHRQWHDSFLTSGIPIRPFQVAITILPPCKCEAPRIPKFHFFWTVSSISLFGTLSGNSALHHNVSVSQSGQITMFHTTAVSFSADKEELPIASPCCI